MQSPRVQKTEFARPANCEGKTRVAIRLSFRPEGRRQRAVVEESGFERIAITTHKWTFRQALGNSDGRKPCPEQKQLNIRGQISRLRFAALEMTETTSSLLRREDASRYPSVIPTGGPPTAGRSGGIRLRMDGDYDSQMDLPTTPGQQRRSEALSRIEATQHSRPDLSTALRCARDDRDNRYVRHQISRLRCAR